MSCIGAPLERKGELLIKLTFLYLPGEVVMRSEGYARK